MKASVVTVGLDPVQVLHLQQHGSVRHSHGDAVGPWRRDRVRRQTRHDGMPSRHDCRQCALQSDGIVRFETADRALYGGVEARPAERLEHIVQGVHVECAYGVLVVRRHENDAARHICAKLLEYLEPVPVRHLNVEEEQIRLQPAHTRDCVQSAGGHSHHADDRVRSQKGLDGLTRSGLVIHYDGAKRLRTFIHTRLRCDRPAERES